MSRLRETLKIGISLKRQFWIGALGNQLSMYLNHDLYFFWVSSLAYPNLLGKKGYVVVVVIRKTVWFLYYLSYQKLNLNLYMYFQVPRFYCLVIYVLQGHYCLVSSSNKKFAKKLFSDKRGEGARDDHGDDSADASNKTPSYLLVCTHILMFRNQDEVACLYYIVPSTMLKTIYIFLYTPSKDAQRRGQIHFTSTSCGQPAFVCLIIC